MKRLFVRAKKAVVRYFVPEIFMTVREIAFNLPSVLEEMPKLRKLRRPAIFWLALSEIFLVAQMYPTKWAADAVLRGESLKLIGLRCLGISGAFVIGSLVNYRASCARNKFTEHLGAILWAEAHRKQLSMDIAWHMKHGTGEKESIIMRNTERAQNYFESYLFEALKIKLRIVCTIIGLLILSPIFGALAGLIFGVYSGLLRRIEPKLGPISEAQHKELKALSEFGGELNQNCLTIKALGLEKYFSGTNWQKLLDYAAAQGVRYPIWRWLINQPEPSLNVSKGGVYFLGLLLIRMSPKFTFGSFMLVVGWMERILSNMYNLIEFEEKSRKGVPAIAELSDIFKIVPQVSNCEHPILKNSWQGKVEFRNVSFRYADGKGNALEGINLVIEPATLVGIVGKTGCGKSTLFKVLGREYDPIDGCVLVDGIDIRHIDYDYYRQRVIGVVQQHIQLFQMTVRNNIRLSRLDAAPGEEVSAAQLAYAEEFILKLDDGYDHKLGENGMELSGGQRQRIGIARALHGQPTILIMDEPTSALDSKSQLMVKQALDSLMERKACTTFIIAHRFSTIRNADIILVMDEGKIVEVGTHAELLRMNGFYARLIELDNEGGFASE